MRLQRKQVKSGKVWINKLANLTNLFLNLIKGAMLIRLSKKIRKATLSWQMVLRALNFTSTKRVNKSQKGLTLLICTSRKNNLLSSYMRRSLLVAKQWQRILKSGRKWQTSKSYLMRLWLNKTKSVMISRWMNLNRKATLLYPMALKALKFKPSNKSYK